MKTSVQKDKKNKVDGQFMTIKKGIEFFDCDGKYAVKIKRIMFDAPILSLFLFVYV